MARDPIGDVVVVLPGILGSVLARDGREVWSVAPGAALRALLSLGRSVKSLALDGDDPDLDDLGDGVEATRLMPDLHLVPGFWKIDGYGSIEKTILERLDVTPGENYFAFPYDWRRDNRVAARKLRRASHDWLRAWRARSGNDDAKLVLLAHSMGGLVARAFLELEEGWEDTRTLVTFGTPYRGSLNALNFLANGFTKRVGPVKLVDLTGLLRSLTSVYQLLPTFECVDRGDGELRRVAETPGLPGVDDRRAVDALGFHRSIEASVTERVGSGNGAGYSTHPVVGIDQRTLLSARLDDGRLVTSTRIRGEDLRGDGTVPRPSAYPQEWESADRGMFSGQVHASLQNDRGVLDHVRGVITAAGLELGRFRREVQLAVTFDDLVEAGESIEVEVECSEPQAEVSLRVTNTDTGQEVASDRVTVNGDRTLPLPGLAEGVYRVSVTAGPATVTDLLVVLEG